MNYFLVFAGGGFGCVLRYVIGLLLQRSQLNFPLATFLANIISCLLFALVLWYVHLKPSAGEMARPLLLAGFCGGLSTFSAFSFETYQLFQKGMFFLALTNIILSCVCCMFLFYLMDKTRA